MTGKYMIALMCAVLLGTGVFWYAQIRPIPITGDEPPLNHQPSPPSVHSIATTTPQASTTPPDVSADTRSWGERFRDTTIPEVPGIVWQTYVNDEYGFEMEYPSTWGVQESKNNLIKGTDFSFYRLTSPGESLFGISIFRRPLKDELIRRDAGWVGRIQKYGLIPDASIHNINLYIQYPNVNSHETLLSAFLEKNGNIHEFGESIFVAYSDVDKLIIEHMMKSFHFLQ